jgi:uncharacterized cupredoxin-like copper-binding protein
MHSFKAVALAATLLAAGMATAHEKSAHEHAVPPYDATQVEEHAFGRQGDPKQVTRTITVDMSDGMRFTPSSLRVKRGTTVRFVVRNRGATLHEMVIGAPADLDEHAALMRKHPGMEHDEPQMAHVKPGARGEIVWQFSQAGEFRFACLILGHYEAGMIGKVVVE